MGTTKTSVATIITAGLTGCYEFLIDGEHGGSLFCGLDHHSYTEDSKNIIITRITMPNNSIFCYTCENIAPDNISVSNK
jgi:hypothetical protein